MDALMRALMAVDEIPRTDPAGRPGSNLPPSYIASSSLKPLPR